MVSFGNIPDVLGGFPSSSLRQGMTNLHTCFALNPFQFGDNTMAFKSSQCYDPFKLSGSSRNLSFPRHCLACLDQPFQIKERRNYKRSTKQRRRFRTQTHGGQIGFVSFSSPIKGTGQGARKPFSLVTRCNSDNGQPKESGSPLSDAENSPSISFLGTDVTDDGLNIRDRSVIEIHGSKDMIHKDEEVAMDATLVSDGSEREERDANMQQLRQLVAAAKNDLEQARINSTKLEEKAQAVAEKAIALKDEAADAEKASDELHASLRALLEKELDAEMAVQKARNAFSAASAQVDLLTVALDEARRRLSTLDDIGTNKESEGNQEKLEEVVQSKTEDLDPAKQEVEVVENGEDKETIHLRKEARALELARAEMKNSEEALTRSELELVHIQNARAELQEEAASLNKAAETAKQVAIEADEGVALAMAVAEKAVALEVEAAQRLDDAEIALQKALSHVADTIQAGMAGKISHQVAKVAEVLSFDEKNEKEAEKAQNDFFEDLTPVNGTRITDSFKGQTEEELTEKEVQFLVSEEIKKGEQESAETTIMEKMATGLFESKRVDIEASKDEDLEKGKAVAQGKKTDNMKETVDSSIPKSSPKRSSRFFPASFFSCDDANEFSPSALFSGILEAGRGYLPKIIGSIFLLLAGTAYLTKHMEKGDYLMRPIGVSTNIEATGFSTKPFIKTFQMVPSQMKQLINKFQPQEVNEEETSLFDVLWLLLASVIFVPIFQKLPGGSPVLGYLAAGVLIGPHTLHIIQNVHGTKAIAEFGVVFLLFNIGLELSIERLSSMKKYVFGFGSIQVLATALAVGLFVHVVSGSSGPAAIVIGNGLALSSTAVVLQVLQERGESTSRHGRATFSVLLFQDLAVVVLLILIPLLSPNSSKGGVGFYAIAEALGVAAIKAAIAISCIIAGGRLLLRPIYKQMAENHNAEIFAANTLLVVLGTSVLTARAGLSMALGAFLAGLLLAETEFALQVESDIAPYRGLLLGLFFMTVGMSIDPRLFAAKLPVIAGALGLLICGKTLLIAMIGRQFGLSNVAAIRAGLLLAPGGEFAFVAFGEAVHQGIMSQQMSSLLFLVVGLSMAITPWLAAGGQMIASKFEQQDVRSLLPAENETDDLQGHMIICGFGRVGQIIAQLLSERLIPFVALDVRSERVSIGRALDLPVYFGDAGNREVLHKIGAGRAAAAVITLDTPGATYRTVWALSKYFPNIKTFVRAHDVDHGINLEKAGATAVVPETLEPSLQLASALLAEAKLPASEIAATVNQFRSQHLSELRELSEDSGTSLGYGFSRMMAKVKLSVSGTPEKVKGEDDGSIERRPDEGIVAVP